MDALDRTTVNGFLDLLFGSPGGIVDFREILIVQTEDLRAHFGTKSAGDTFFLVDHGDLIHETPPFLPLRDSQFPIPIERRYKNYSIAME
jgi:hypothetical protein